MNIFNSLGSNYQPSFVRQSLLAWRSAKASRHVAALLGEHYQGVMTLTYKGREALELALQRSGLPAGSAVGLNGFTCYVVYQAIQNAGYEPVFIDVAKDQLNFGVNELEKTHHQYPNLKAIIIQNTLGLACDLAPLETYCQQHDLLLIEDLAHSLGMRYATGQEAGTVGQLAMLSFSRDKTLDVVAGGAFIDRLHSAKTEHNLAPIGVRYRLHDRFYPALTWLIRVLYPIQLGCILHFVLKRLHILTTPMDDELRGLHRMTPEAERLLLGRWKLRAAEIKHRQAIATIYQQVLPKEIQFESLSKSEPTFLRFPIRVSQWTSLIAHLKRHGVHIGDTWYDAPVAPARYLAKTNYRQGECPRAEELAAQIVNLPTHTNINEVEAYALAREVNKWLESEPA